MASRKSRFTRRKFIGATAAASLVFGVPTLLRAQARSIKVGLVHPITGFLAYSGGQSRMGAMLAIDEINAAGGIKAMGGAKLEALLGDNQAKPEVGVSVVEQMQEAGVSAYIGCFSSAVALPATQAAAKYNTPFVIDVGASDNIVNRGLKNVFRLKPGFNACVDDAILGLGEINKAAGNPTKSAVLVHEESEFGTGTAKLLAAKLPSIGIEVKEVMKHANPTRDFANLALRIRGLKPDLVVMSNYQNEYVLLARTLHQQKVDLAGMFSVLGGGFNYKFVKELPEVAQYMIDTNHWFDPTNPRAQAMKKRVEAKGDLFTFEVYLSYNAVKFLAHGMERAGSVDKEKVNAALAASTWSDHFMPYGPTKMVDGQNTGGKASIQQASKTDIEVIWPAKSASAKPVFPKPKFS
ncbi:MAG: ABC transporter substrate-binding protein [Betaproteobacteria bacterium]|nr:ABC transporter substrate-binding protein [Betaproteobacteria bacterium]MSQ89485.1 ABC transporter substrate-binding protein [Betaproteobacteria bacterium]